MLLATVMTVSAWEMANLIGIPPIAAETIGNIECNEVNKKAMPDLQTLYLRTDPHLRSTGRVIKGLYYATRPEGPNKLVAFLIGCAEVLDPRPFLLFDFDTNTYLLDAEGDGCVDGAGVLVSGEIDPVEFLPALPEMRRICKA